MKKFKLFTGLILPAVAIGAVAAPIMLTTACTKNFEIGPFFNCEPSAAPVVSATCSWKGRTTDSTTFQLGSTHTFVFKTIGTAKDYSIMSVPLFLLCIVPNNPDAQSNPDLYFSKTRSKNTLTIKILQSIHSQVEIKSESDPSYGDNGQIDNHTSPQTYGYSSFISFHVA